MLCGKIISSLPSSHARRSAQILRGFFSPPTDASVHLSLGSEEEKTNDWQVGRTATGELFERRIYLDKPVRSAAGASPELAWWSAGVVETFVQHSPRRSPRSHAQSRGPVTKDFCLFFGKILLRALCVNWCLSDSGGHLIIIQKMLLAQMLRSERERLFFFDGNNLAGNIIEFHFYW